MNKILVVGHEQSRYQKIAQLLEECGVKNAMPSQAYKLSAEEVGVKLLQASDVLPNSQDVTKHTAAHGRKNRKPYNKAAVQTVYAMQSVSPYAQRQPKKTFNTLAFDLLLANSEQSLWGWADTNAVSLLDYWADFDEEMFFVLVYDKPDSPLQLALNNDTEAELQPQWEDWIAYNQALLQFATKYSNRCVLVNAEQAMKHKAQFLQSLLAKKLPVNHLTSDESTSKAQLGADEQALDLYHQLIEIQKQKVFVEQKTVYDVFLAMQNRADLAGQFDNYQPISKEQVIEAYTALYQSKADQDNQATVTQLQQQVQSLNAELDAKKSEIEPLKQKEQNTQTKITQLQQQVQSLNAELAAKESEIESLKQKEQNTQTSKALAEENNLLIAQLHHTQEELEKYYLENQRLKSEQPQPAAANLPSTAVYYGAAERVKQDLPYRLGATMVSHSKSTKDLAKLPVALFKEYQEFQKHQGDQKDLPPIEEYQDAKEAEKVKKHLSYKLGKTLVDGVKSPKSILDLPVKMGKEIVGFKK
ncbi:hypothetical protein [Moraxella sp. RCAD0137]|uniref:hypothetical protein n=1 Tax=Moraxella sp. RCAD0137 TaxID=1775913 RepID=UPI000C9F2C53|nr:hypothetical protein [Moraxella sp. RCAD0137]PNP97631.1 hypothetical protein AZ602_06350 [Moraxella sp. RCAD0137]